MHIFLKNIRQIYLWVDRCFSHMVHLFYKPVFQNFLEGTIKHAFVKIFNNYCWKIIKILHNEFFGYTISFFFYQGFLSLTLTIHRLGRGPSFIPLYHFHPLTNIERFVWNFACEMTITYF